MAPSLNLEGLQHSTKLRKNDKCIFYKIFSYRNENRHNTSFTKYKDNIFTKIVHEDTWPLRSLAFLLDVFISTLTGSGSGSLDGIPGSLDGLHKTSWKIVS